MIDDYYRALQNWNYQKAAVIKTIKIYVVWLTGKSLELILLKLTLIFNKVKLNAFIVLKYFFWKFQIISFKHVINETFSPKTEQNFHNFMYKSLL